MPWNLLIFPLIGGYILISESNYLKYKHQRLSEQRIIFSSILYGISLLFFTLLIRFVVEYTFPNSIQLIHSYFPIKQPFIVTAIFSFLFSLLFVFIGNETLFKNTERQIKIAIKEVGNELELLILEFYDNNLLQFTNNNLLQFTNNNLLQFTLNTGKVYIGHIKKLSPPSENNYIQIYLIISGYRDKKKVINFTTSYITENLKTKNTVLFINLNTIITVSPFNFKVYEEINDNFNKES